MVGKEQVQTNREMHWLRIDRYFEGEPTRPNPEVVAAADDVRALRERPVRAGLPGGRDRARQRGPEPMVYNRCIGTRYCSNNCPYKVRRFNYFDFHSKDPAATTSPGLASLTSSSRNRST